MSNSKTYNARMYTYPDGSRDILAAQLPIFRSPDSVGESGEQRHGAARVAGKKSEGDDRLRSVRRARAQIRRLALANSFEWFVTLTLDQAKVDRYDPSAIMRKVNSWLSNMVRRKGLRYILVPELHKDGAYHFHGFFAADGLQTVDSGHVDKGGHPVYNLPQWTLGFSTAIRLYGDYHQAVGYTCKYIGKQNGERPMGRWYYSGGDLKEPIAEVFDVNFGQLSEMEDAFTFDTAIGLMAVYRPKMEVEYEHQREETDQGPGRSGIPEVPFGDRVHQGGGPDHGEGQERHDLQGRVSDSGRGNPVRILPGGAEHAGRPAVGNEEPQLAFSLDGDGWMG